LTFPRNEHEKRCKKIKWKIIREMYVGFSEALKVIFEITIINLKEFT